jgi:hypothetical protein
MKNNQKTAFSIIELSIIMILIGLIITGVVVTRSDLFLRANNNKIIAATKYSVLREIDDLAIWFDAATDESFKNSEMTANNPLTMWKNISPKNYGNFNVEQLTPTNQPTYSFDDNDALPLLRFDGSDLLSTANIISGYNFAKQNQITVFLVQKYNSPLHTANSILWNPSVDNVFSANITNISGNIIWGFANSQISATPSGFLNSWNIVTLVRNSNNNGQIRVNGSNLQTAVMSDNLNISASDNLDIGTGLNGDLREIAIFKRELSPLEIKSVEKYLSDKWDINLN